MKHNPFRNSFLITLVIDFLLLNISLYFSYSLRFDFSIPESFFRTYLGALAPILAIKIICFYAIGLYRGMWRYTSIADVLNILKACTLSTLLIIAYAAIISRFEGFPRSVFLIDWGFSILLISGFRLGIRVWYAIESGSETPAQAIRYILQRVFSSSSRSNAKRLIIIGAGNCGEQIFREIQGNERHGYDIVGFIDDNVHKHNLYIHGVPVLGGMDDLERVIGGSTPDELLIAIPSANSLQMRRIVDKCKACKVPYKTIPGYGELIDGRVSVSAIREVAYRDLIGREIVHLDEGCIEDSIGGRTVMVTGAGGSIGAELCRQLCRFKPGKLILLERAESPLYEIEIELKRNFPDIDIVPVLNDILDISSLERIFEKLNPNIVFHAAAYKHVPMLEIQPWQAIENNIFGTHNMVTMSNRFDIERFVMVSTDKAVRPANIMGASKRVAEMLVQCQRHQSESSTRYMIVRFGNVVGSVGSVVPLFKNQIALGGPVTVTHPEVTRYFMTIPEACQLILQAGTMGNGNEIFILDMGTPIKIADMARDLIKLSGFEPDVDISIKYIGLRPGEKLYEELITKGEGIVPTDHKNILVLNGDACDLNHLINDIDTLRHLAKKHDAAGIQKHLTQIVPEYHPSGR